MIITNGFQGDLANVLCKVYKSEGLSFNKAKFNVQYKRFLIYKSELGILTMYAEKFGKRHRNTFLELYHKYLK